MNTVQQITEKLGKYLNVTLWEKNGNVRLYIKGVGYNTKKMKTNAYIDLITFRVVVYVDCPSQPSAWCQSQADDVTGELEKYARYARMIASASNEGKSIETVVEEIEVNAHNEELAQQEVIGVYSQWESMRVSINRFGKLATRNRLVVYKFRGTKATAPSNFIELPEEIFEVMLEKSILEPYTEVEAEIEYRVQRAIRLAEQAANN